MVVSGRALAQFVEMILVVVEEHLVLAVSMDNAWKNLKNHVSSTVVNGMVKVPSARTILAMVVAKKALVVLVQIALC
jgi:hypothetical protein